MTADESQPIKLHAGSTQYGSTARSFGSDSTIDRPVEAMGPDWAVARDLSTGMPMLHVGDLASGRADNGKAANRMTGKQPATGNEQRIEAAARALANEAAPESHLEHWGTQPEYLKDKFRRRAALALAAADAVDVMRRGGLNPGEIWQEGRESLAADMLRPVDEFGRRSATPNPYLETGTAPIQEALDLGLEPAARPAAITPAAAAPKDVNCDGYCRGSVCSYCGCCMHSADPGNCRTSSAPAGMRCPESGCGCEGTA